MALLEKIDRPQDLRQLTMGELTELAGEIRDFLIESVSRTGGHLGPNLGVVELTIALHRVFDSPKDRIVWDTGHQSYVHKILTGRRSGFGRLRQTGGMSGYPSRAESGHDVTENSHASTAPAYADGLARAYEFLGVTDRAVVAVIGDGALTGGMPWEALNNIAGAQRCPVIIVFNDNERSYAPTAGGLADHFADLRAGRTGPGVFEQLGLAYLGPVDGHDLEAVEAALRKARALGESVVVHVVTEKGRGYVHAENNELDRAHSIRPADPVSGVPVGVSAPSWTSVFGDEIVKIAEAQPDVVAITAAMLEPTGLRALQARFPDRVLDVGIAEQHAVTLAAGLAMGGMHPVVAIYATFVNRAFDQVLMDVALHRCPVTFVLDRAGVTGDDGASHNGMWDMSIMQVVPGLRIAAPRDGARLRELLGEAVGWDEGPTLVRFPKGPTGPDLPAVATFNGLDILHRSGDLDVLVVAVGAMAGLALEVADRLADQGIGVTVVDPRWVVPVNDALSGLAARHRMVVTAEDNGRTGGVGSGIAQALRDAGVRTPLRDFGIPRRFLDHGKRADVLAACGLTAQDISLAVVEYIAGLESSPDNLVGSMANGMATGAQGNKEEL
ncbi:1-deoxy-D-xylulose-5-phosphate synthase [Actinomadura scrupuli]|uniref:1-deoxy-D-xylulose-5-phosphate synthase n=1 Tax=Actinomadura scrupuli TaxID=559629 RepID=UPI003D977E80